MLLRINWTITDVCNYKCDYCYNSNCGRDSKLNLIKINLVLKKILELGYTQYEFVLTGGEPTNFIFLIDIIKKIYESFENKLKSINIITNFSQSEKYFYNLLTQFDNRLSLRVSCHLKYFNNNYMKKLKNILNLNKKIYFSILLDQNFYSLKLIEIIYKTNCLYLENKKIFFPSLRYIFQKNYSKIEKYIFNFINKMWGTNKNIYKKNIQYGKYCIFGLNLLIISSDLTFSGSYCPATQKNKTPIIFYSASEIKNRIRKIIKCRMSCCMIPTNHLLYKFSSKQDAIRFLKENN